MLYICLQDRAWDGHFSSQVMNKKQVEGKQVKEKRPKCGFAHFSGCRDRDGTPCSQDGRIKKVCLQRKRVSGCRLL